MTAPRVLAFTAADYERARRRLMRRDPVLAGLIRAHGRCRLAEAAADRPDPFSAIVRAITAQQLSAKAAQTIYRRFLVLFGDAVSPEGIPARVPTPAEVAGVSDDRLRSVGLSRQKIGYIRDLCAKVLDGTVHLDRLAALDDDQVVEALTGVRGLGRWSAEMFLIFRLNRPDVLPVNDLGIARAIQRAYRLRKPPRPERMRKIAEPWRPYRSVACWYLWRSLHND